MSRRKIKLVSFADGPYIPRTQEFITQAQEMKLFNEIIIYNSANLSENFKMHHLEYMRNTERGFGFWIWKPQAILETLDHSSPDDLIIYIDIGFTLNPNGRNRFVEYIEITLESEWKMLSFYNTHTEYKWTKMDLAKRLSIDHSALIMKTTQLASGLIFLCKTESNDDLINEWKTIAIESNYHFSDNSPSAYPNHPLFKEHRHDASIASLLRKIRGTAITHYEVQAYPHFEDQKELLPAWATRLRK